MLSSISRARLEANKLGGVLSFEFQLGKYIGAIDPGLSDRFGMLEWYQ